MPIEVCKIHIRLEYSDNIFEGTCLLLEKGKISDKFLVDNDVKDTTCGRPLMPHFRVICHGMGV